MSRVTYRITQESDDVTPEDYVHGFEDPSRVRSGHLIK